MGIPFESARLRRATALVVAGPFAFTFGGCSRVAPIAPPPESSVPPLVLAQRYPGAAAAIPADRYDLDARAAELPAGIDASFVVARDEIGAESYSGALLGADSAYQNRGANSVDRAQLLAHLLAAKNIEVRYASCRLDATAAEALATQLFVAPRVPMSATPAAKISRDDSAYLRIRDRGERDFAAVKTALASDASPVPAASGPYLVAEWLEFTVTLPNGKSDTLRRYLFDRGGSAWRASAEHNPIKARLPLQAFLP